MVRGVCASHKNPKRKAALCFGFFEKILSAYAAKKEIHLTRTCATQCCVTQVRVTYK